MKKLIQILGIVALAIVVILNIVYTADMNSGEQISIKFSSFIYIIGLIITAILIYFITEVINKHLYNGINEEKKVINRNWGDINAIGCHHSHFETGYAHIKDSLC